jgi:hypothetical protein
LLPHLHDKTHFKAAFEYSLGDELTHRSLHDNGREIERHIKDGHNRMSRINAQKREALGRSYGTEVA